MTTPQTVQRLDDTTIVIHTGPYGACEITSVGVDVYDRLTEEDPEDIEPDERYRTVTFYGTVTIQAGGGIINTRMDRDPDALALTSEAPSAATLAQWAREAADDFAAAAVAQCARDRLAAAQEC